MPINRKTTPNKSASVLAPQRQQVIDLARDGLAQTQTVRECLQRRDLAERAVVIVDEAGQIDGRQLLDLIRFIRDRKFADKNRSVDEPSRSGSRFEIIARP